MGSLLLDPGPWHHSSCKIWKKSSDKIQSYENASFPGTKGHIFPQHGIFGNRINWKHLLATFTVQNFKKIIEMYSELWRRTNFSPKRFFFEKTIIITFRYLLALSLCKILKKPFELILSYNDASFSGPIWLFGPNNNFSRKIIKIIFMYLLATFTVQNN